MSDKKLYIIAGGLLALVFVLIFIVVFSKGLGGPGGDGERAANLEFWGVYDDDSFYREIISDFSAQYPNIRINYRKFTFEEYERQLLDSFAAGQGPDIWLMHHTWLPKHKNKIAPLPLADKNPLFTLKQFQDQFVEVAQTDLVSDERIYGMPLYVDTLGLYYNKTVFNTMGITKAPGTWEQTNEDVKKITQLDSQGRITRSGISLGTAGNINRATDILSTMMLQSGLKLVEGPNSGAELTRAVEGKDIGEVALQYYTDFANPSKEVYAWNEQQDYSIDAFRQGKTAMMINYSHEMSALRVQDPRFNFGVAPMPQISSDRVVNYANYWAPTVSKSSKNIDAAWQFIVFLTSKDEAAKYINASRRPPARRDLIDIVRNDPDLGPFSVQALSAVSWHQADNLAIENILRNLINDVNLSRRSIRDALRYAENQINILTLNQQPR